MTDEHFKTAMLKMNDGTMLIGYGLTNEEAEADAMDSGKKRGKLYKEKDRRSAVIRKCRGSLVEQLKWKEKTNGNPKP